MQCEQLITITTHFDKFDDELKQKVKTYFDAEISLVQAEKESEEYSKIIIIEGDQENVEKAQDYLLAVFDPANSSCQIFEFAPAFDEIVEELIPQIEKECCIYVSKCDTGCLFIYGKTFSFISKALTKFETIVNNLIDSCKDNVPSNSTSNNNESVILLSSKAKKKKNLRKKNLSSSLKTGNSSAICISDSSPMEVACSSKVNNKKNKRKKVKLDSNESSVICLDETNNNFNFNPTLTNEPSTSNEHPNKLKNKKNNKTKKNKLTGKKNNKLSKERDEEDMEISDSDEGGEEKEMSSEGMNDQNKEDLDIKKRKRNQECDSVSKRTRLSRRLQEQPKDGQRITANQKNQEDPSSLRTIVIDGCNVAMSHGLGNLFSYKGIQLVVEYFKKRGHQKVVAFLPQWRRSPVNQKAKDIHILEDLYKSRNLVFTASRKAGHRYISSYDDRYILKYASDEDGIVITNDQYKDLYDEVPSFRETIERRLLQVTFVGDTVMFPDDPLGRDGPSLEQFLFKSFDIRLPASSQLHPIKKRFLVSNNNFIDNKNKNNNNNNGNHNRLNTLSTMFPSLSHLKNLFVNSNIPNNIHSYGNLNNHLSNMMVIRSNSLESRNLLINNNNTANSANNNIKNKNNMPGHEFGVVNQRSSVGLERLVQSVKRATGRPLSFIHSFLHRNPNLTDLESVLKKLKS